ncbi:CBL-interacting protein kinase 9-like [Vigna unguiculata]|nr:CBL-interacting protein kinase 9-like [Vigna unguiculata]
MLDPNPVRRITIDDMYQDLWFITNYQPLRFSKESVSFDYDSPDLPAEKEERGSSSEAPIMNAFEISSTYLGFNLIGNLFSKVHVKLETSFISKSPILDIVGEIEYRTARLGFEVQRKNYQININSKEELARRKGHLSIVTKVYEMVSPYYMVVVRNASGDNLQFHEFCEQLYAELRNIIWKTEPLQNG